MAFLEQLLKKAGPYCANGSVMTVHAQYNRQSPLRAWLFFVALFHIKMHISCFSIGKKTEVTVEIPEVPCCSTVFTFYKQKVPILQGDGHLVEQAELSQLLLTSVPFRMKSVEAAESQKALFQTSSKTEYHPTYSFFFYFPLLLSITAENFQHPSPTDRSIKQVSSA